MLGGHTSAVRSALVYARDGLGRPFRMLEKLLLEVRLGQFLPDATRSGRFPGALATTLNCDDGAHSEFSYAPSLGFGDTLMLQPTTLPMVTVLNLQSNLTKVQWSPMQLLNARLSLLNQFGS